MEKSLEQNLGKGFMYQCWLLTRKEVYEYNFALLLDFNIEKAFITQVDTNIIQKQKIYSLANYKHIGHSWYMKCVSFLTIQFAVKLFTWPDYFCSPLCNVFCFAIYLFPNRHSLGFSTSKCSFLEALTWEFHLMETLRKLSLQNIL